MGSHHGKDSWGKAEAWSCTWQLSATLQALPLCYLEWFSSQCISGLKGHAEGGGQRLKGSPLRSLQSLLQQAGCCSAFAAACLPLLDELFGLMPALSRAGRDLSCMAPLFNRNHGDKTKRNNTEKQSPVTFLFKIIFMCVCVCAWLWLSKDNSLKNCLRKCSNMKWLAVSLLFLFSSSRMRDLSHLYLKALFHRSISNPIFIITRLSFVYIGEDLNS